MPMTKAGSTDADRDGSSARQPVTVLVVDDHRLFTAGLSAIIQLLPMPVTVLERDNARTALRELEAGLSIDLLLVDVDMPSLNGLDLLIALQQRRCLPKSIVISATSNPRLVERVFAAGARGFVPKSLPPGNMIAAIQSVLTGGSYLPPDLKRAPRAAAESPSGDSVACQLSDRQLQVLGLIGRGRSNKEIADVLEISLSTVKFHVTTLFRLLNVRTRTECVHVARQRGLME